jgi:HEAT repeat protein/pimeloyl-ACP methyl ester carboxylesterase
VFALAAIPGATSITAQDAEVSKREIARTLANPNSHVRHELWTKLNPEDKTQLNILLQILKKKSWYDRDGAIKALATAATDEVIEKIVKNLKKHKDPAVRQGMAVVLAKMNDDKFYPHLYEALYDKDPMVRRIVAHSLRIRKKKDAVEALVQAFQKEKDPTCRTFLEQSLNELTQAFKGPDPLAWLIWWQEAKLDKDYKLGKTDEEAKKAAEELGFKLKKRKTVSVTGGVTLETEERGGGLGVPILVIPHWNLSKEVFKPFLSELEKNHKIFYIDLPEVKSFKNLTTVSAKNVPYYPLEPLVDAFEDLRKATKQKHFAIMACGMNSWIAMEYARKYPRSVAALLFVAPQPTRKSFADATKRFVRTGPATKDTELHYLGLSRTFNTQTGESSLDAYHREKSIPEWEGEGGCIDRRAWSLYFADSRDTFISVLYPQHKRYLGGVAIPDYDLFKKPKPKRRIPTLVIAGKASLYNTVEESKATAKFYGGICLEYRRSSCMPFYEEGARFNKDVARFLKKFTRKAPKKKKKSKKDSK